MRQNFEVSSPNKVWVSDISYIPTDEGWLYLAAHKDLLHMIPSMSRKGNCYDNAPIESFWGTLKNELIYQKRYATREEAIREITEYIEIFYNLRAYTGEA